MEHVQERPHVQLSQVTPTTTSLPEITNRMGMKKQDTDSRCRRERKWAYYLLVVPSWAVAVASLSCLCASVSPPCRSCTLLLPHELQAASIEKKGLLQQPTQPSHAQVLRLLSQSPVFLLCSFSSTWSSAVSLFLILCRLNWMEQNFMNADPKLKKSRIQYVYTSESVTERHSFIHRLHFLSQEVQHDPTFC